MADNEIMELVKEQVLHWRSELKIRGMTEDIVQDVCVKLIEGGNWEHKPAFISKVVKNHLLDMRKKKELQLVELDEAEDVPAPLISGDRQEWLNKALRGFSWSEQKAIRQRLQGCSMAEIAKNCGLSKAQTERIIKETTDRLSDMWNRPSGK